MTTDGYEPQTPVPHVVASYAAYLNTRTRATPDTAISGDDAQLTVSIGTKILLLAFKYRHTDWYLRSTELRDGDQTTTYARGELAKAVAALMRP
jgi:hypothetical protein